MLEKLYNVIEAVDIFDENSPIPERYLVFMDGDGNQIKQFFPKDRMTLFFEGKLYDWYGREIKPKSGTTKILSHFGCADHHGDGSKYYEAFVVKSKNGRLSIAELDVSTEERPSKNLPKTTDQNLAKIHTLPFAKPSLRTLNWSFKDFQEPPIKHHCMHELNKYLQKNFDYTCKICTDVISPCVDIKDHSTVFVKTVFQGGEELFKHCIFDLSDIKDHNTSYQGPSDSTLGITAYKMKHMFDCVFGLSFSKDGNKMTAFVESPFGNKKIRVSTRADIICHPDGQIFWYYDPEP